MDVIVGLLQRYLVEKKPSGWLSETHSAGMPKDVTMCSVALSNQCSRLYQIHFFWSIRGSKAVHPEQLACCQATKQSLTRCLTRSEYSSGLEKDFHIF